MMSDLREVRELTRTNEGKKKEEEKLTCETFWNGGYVHVHGMA